jgi:hypothetical protein
MSGNYKSHSEALKTFSLNEKMVWVDPEESRRLYSETIFELEKIADECETRSYFFPPRREKIRMTSFVCVWYGVGPQCSGKSPGLGRSRSPL